MSLPVVPPVAPLIPIVGNPVTWTALLASLLVYVVVKRHFEFRVSVR